MAAVDAAATAKATLRRLAQARLEPTPENYARAWAEELGAPAPAELSPRARPVLERLVARAVEGSEAREALLQPLLAGRWDDAARKLGALGEGSAQQARLWATLIERLLRGLERGSSQWTLARRKDSALRVLEASGGDQRRMQQRLSQLVAAWDGDTVEPAGPPTGADAAAPSVPVQVASSAAAPAAVPAAREADATLPWHAALLATLPTPHALAEALADWRARWQAQGPSAALADEAARLAPRAQAWLGQREALLAQLHQLAVDLGRSLGDVAEEGSWVQGQMQGLADQLDGPPSHRSVRDAAALLQAARSRQDQLRVQRAEARDALRQAMHQMLQDLGEIDAQTGRLSQGLTRYVDTLGAAQSLDDVAGAVRDMLAEGQLVQQAVHGARTRLQGEHDRARQLEQQVQALETELRRLSDEVATDALTQVANRRGLEAAFTQESARAERDGSSLAVALLDIDNFKRLNDQLGHAAGDAALVALAQHVQAQLRPMDRVARYGGEEFAVLLPATAVADAQQTLTRLQRLLSASLFMHDGQEVFVTFSAGVTGWRAGEELGHALARADEALYEAKRTGKNRTCVA